jgi:hypothetical protein
VEAAKPKSLVFLISFPHIPFADQIGPDEYEDDATPTPQVIKTIVA